MKRLPAILLTLAASLTLVAQEPAPQVEAPPAPAAPREAKVPQPVEKTLANGLRVIVVPKHDIPLVAARLMVKSGGAADPRGREGLADLTATVLTQGTKTQSAEQIARGIEALGATLESNAGWDSLSVDVSVMSPNLAKAMTFVADVVRNPTFAKEEFERERAQAIDALQVSLTQPGTLASAVASRLVFGAAPYGGRLGGTPASLEKITRDDLIRYHKANFAPANAVLLFAGDVKPDDAFRLADTLFGNWKATAAKPAVVAEVKPPAPRVVIVDMPDAGQAAVVVSRPGIRRNDPAYLQAMVANSVLGGGYSSRLNQEIRIKRGLSYGAGSSFDARAGVGPFAASTQTKNESAAEVAEIIRNEVARLGTGDLPEAELTPRRATLIGDFAQSLETTGGIVRSVGALALHGLPLSDINRYISGVQAVTGEQVKKFAATRLPSNETSVVVVGDASKFRGPLEKSFGEVEVIPVGDLDLNSPTLRVRKAKE